MIKGRGNYLKRLRLAEKKIRARNFTRISIPQK